jgi:hypothetical protein
VHRRRSYGENAHGLTEAAQLLQKISKGAAMRRDWEERNSTTSEEDSQVRVLTRIFRKETSEAKEEQPKLEEDMGATSDDEVLTQVTGKDESSEKGRTLGSAKSLREFEQLDWIPINFGKLFDKVRPHPSLREAPRLIIEDFPPDSHTGYTIGKESAGDIIRKLFEDENEELDLESVKEAERIMGIKSESSPYAHIAQVYATRSNQGEGMSPTPRVDCMIKGECFREILCDVGAQVSVMTSNVYAKLFSTNTRLDTTLTKLIMGDSRITKPLGVLRDVDVTLAGKCIPTYFFVIDVGDKERECVILGKPFLKLANAIIDIGKGIVTFEFDGKRHEFNFYSNHSRALPLPLDNKEVESVCFVDSLRDPLQRALKGNPNGEQDEELMEATEELREKFGHIREEKFEDIRDLDQQMEDDASDVELKPLPGGLKYEFLGDNKTFPVIVSNELNPEETEKLLKLLRKHKKVIGYSINDLKGISPAFCTHRIQLEEQCKPVIEHQRRLSHGMRDVVKKEVTKLLNAGIIYPVPHSEWVSPVHCVPKKGGLTVVKNDNDQLIPQRTVTGWRMCIDYRKLNKATRKDHFPLPFIDEMLERLAKHSHFCYLDGYSGFFQIPIHPKDQHKTTFTCPYGTFAYRRMPFGLCNAPASFQRCMMAIFSDFIEEIMEVFMDDFSVYDTSFEHCLANLEKVLASVKKLILCLIGKSATSW